MDEHLVAKRGTSCLTESEEDPMAATPRPLWEWVFLWIGEHSNLGILHPLDENRAKEVIADLSAVGERPSYAQVKAFLAARWPEHLGAQRRIREFWRQIERNPAHRFRLLRPPRRFYTLDRLVEEHGLLPLETRLATLATEAIAATAIAVNRGSTAEFERLRAECDRVTRALEDLRALRFGPASVGRYWDKFEHAQPPAGTRGAIE
jgi:hypothetical protein